MRVLRLRMIASMLWVLAATGMASTCFSCAICQASEKKEILFLATERNGVVERREIRVEVMRSDADRARGLMYRRSLKANEGMLFLFGAERELSMWMRNTYIPLDMIFIKSDGRIHRIERNAEPLSETIISSEGRASAVLEVLAGSADSLGIRTGDRIEHPALRTKAQ